MASDSQSGTVEAAEFSPSLSLRTHLNHNTIPSACICLYRMYSYLLVSFCIFTTKQLIMKNCCSLNEASSVTLRDVSQNLVLLQYAPKRKGFCLTLYRPEELALQLTKPTGCIVGVRFLTEKVQNTRTANEATLNTILCGIARKALSPPTKTAATTVLSSLTSLLA